MKLGALLVAVAVARDTNLGEKCDRDATKTCTLGNCCTTTVSRTPSGGSASALSYKLCLPSSTAASATYTDTAATPIVYGGATNDVYTYTCPNAGGASNLAVSAAALVALAALAS